MQVAKDMVERQAKNEFFTPVAFTLLYAAFYAFKPAAGLGGIVVAPVIACILVGRGHRRMNEGVISWGRASIWLGYALAAFNVFYWISYFGGSSVPLPK